MRSALFVLTLSLVACSSGGNTNFIGSDAGTEGTADGSAGRDAGAAKRGSDASSNPDDETPPPTPTYSRKTLAFDELTDGTEVTDQYKKWVTFSSEAGCALEVSSSAGLAVSEPYYLMTYYSCAQGESASIFMDFAKPVRAPKLAFVGVNGSAKVATLKLVHEDGTTSQRDVTGKGNYATPVVVDLPKENDVTRIEIVDVDDDYGLGIDDLSFDVPD